MMRISRLGTPIIVRMCYAAVASMLPMLAAEGQGPSGFYPRPALPYDATTLEQDALLATADELAGDGVEADAVAACERLLADTASPFELRRWAAYRLMEILAMTGWEEQALEVGNGWLAAHPADPMALNIRMELAKIAARTQLVSRDSGSSSLNHYFEAVFLNHDPLDWQVIKARLDYALFLLNVQGGQDAHEGWRQAWGQLLLAEVAVQEKLVGLEADSAQARRGEEILKMVNRALELAEAALAKPDL